MAGVPGGFEDEYSDDDFDFNDEKYREYYEISNASNVEATKHDNLFDLLRTNHINVNEQLHLKNEDFRTAVVNDNKSYIEEALKEGFDPDTILKSGWSGIFYAASNGYAESVNLLLEHKASVNLSCDSFTPLMAVCLSSRKQKEDDLVKCADCLIQHGAKINDHDKHLMTPLMYASKQGYARLVKLLCDQGALKNHQESRGWTAMSFAAANGFSHVVKVLLECGADHEITSFDGQKPMDIAFSNGYSMLSDLLEKYDGYNTTLLENVPAKSSTLSKSSSKFVSYGDLELFLFGLELGHLVPKFQEHHLSFSQVLKLTEEELIQVGVDQLGARKKLYSALQDVRSNEWDTSSLSTDSMAKLSTLETAAVIANVAKHLECLQSCVVYVKKMIKKRHKELTADNRNLQKSVIRQCDAAYQMSKNLNEELNQLNSGVILLFPNADKKSADFIEKSDTSPMSKRKVVICTCCVGVVGVIGVTAFLGYKMWNGNHR